jgi:Ni/Co efflux regulator RcnB
MALDKISCLLLAATLGIGSTAFAQDNVTDYSDRAVRSGRLDMGRQGRALPERRDWRDYGREGAYAYGARGPEWRRGARIPPEYRNRQYVVQDWQAHHLRPPPPGHQWVQVGSDYVLVAVATGIIAELLLSH